MRRPATFVLALSYLSIILILGLLFFVKRSWLCFVPDAFGPIPVGVPWFGALGAVLISLTGVFEHEHDWDESFWPWHVARPLIGVGLSVIAVLILKAGILAVGSNPLQPVVSSQAQPAVSPQAHPAGSPQAHPAGSPQAHPAGSPQAQPAGSPQAQPAGSPQPQPVPVPANLLYYLIAFLVGYREETFRELIKRLVDVILTPGSGDKDGPTISNVNPTQAPHNTQTPVVITGSGFIGTQTVRFGNSAAQFTINADGQLTVTTPVMASAGLTVPLTVTTKSGTTNVQFSFT